MKRSPPLLHFLAETKESQQFTTPQSGGQLQVEQGEAAAMVCFCQIEADFLLREDLHFLLFQLWQLAALGRIHQNQPLGYRLLQAVAQEGVDTAHYPGAETFILQLDSVFTLDTPALLEIVVEPLDLDSRQLLQFDIADAGDDMVVDVVLPLGRLFRQTVRPGIRPASLFTVSRFQLIACCFGI